MPFNPLSCLLILALLLLICYGPIANTFDAAELLFLNFCTLQPRIQGFTLPSYIWVVEDIDRIFASGLGRTGCGPSGHPVTNA